MTDEAAGMPVEPDDPWVAAKKEMYPAASMIRIGANARFTVATISVVGTALTALGIVTEASIRMNTGARILAIVAATTALLAVLSALSYLAVRLEKRNYENLIEVKQWYGRQFRRARLVVIASWLLIAAVTMAGLAGLIAGWSPGGANAPVLSLVVQEAVNERTVTASVSLTGLHPGAIVTVQVTGGADQILVMGKTAADSTGAAKLEAKFVDASSTGGYRLALRVDGRDRGSLEVP